MKKPWILAIPFLLLVVISCQSKKKKEAVPKRTSALNFIQSQVAQIDTSLYSIRKITFIDSMRTDTVYYSREQFRQLAADFLSLPDISSEEFDGRFKEEEGFDEMIGRLTITNLPVKPDAEEIQRQEILIQPDQQGGGRITSIIINFNSSNKDSSVQKRMLWQVDKSFQVATTRQYPGQPEQSSLYRVVWNEEEEQ
ncbi:MAG: hypothetical protein H7Y42_08245 [Chitinophagaceae bacterium]|nr:hypothetical protein [Chitinophagaceae bacterium]